MDNAYVSLVKRLAAARDPEIISNGSTEHASVLMTEMLRHGKGAARIFSGSLNPTLYGRDEFVTTLGDFLVGDNSTVQILVQEDDGRINATNLLSQVNSRVGPEIANRIEVRLAGADARNVPFHFATVGDRFFRFEPDRSKHEAFASFGQPEHVETLKGVFASYWNTASVFEPSSVTTN